MNERILGNVWEEDKAELLALPVSGVLLSERSLDGGFSQVAGIRLRSGIWDLICLSLGTTDSLGTCAFSFSREPGAAQHSAG